MSIPDYSVPQEAEAIFRREILGNPLVRDLPPGLDELGRLVRFQGNALPGLPVNWRWAESISALKAFEATMLNHLLSRKYGVPPVEVTINTDHASLFVLSPALARVVDAPGPASSAGDINPNTLKPYRSDEERRSSESLHRLMATNIYKARDGRFFHVHGSLNPDTTISALGLPLDGEPDDALEDVLERFQSRVSQHDAETLDELMNERHRQAGTVAWTSDEYFASAHGKANAGVGLYELVPDPESRQPAAWWPDHDSLPSSPQRPLAGLRVVDLTRVIAGPTITRSLAELGASVMRVTSPHLPDYTSAHRDLNWGKWNCSLHLRDDDDRRRLRELIAEADVVVDGYRPGALERLGFGRKAVFDLVRGRGRGIVHLAENCYGWHGPWAHRSGWQGISDACCGVSLSYGRAMGVDEAVTPPFPNSDHCTGVIGSAAILHALVQRAEKGGSYGVDVSLNYYSQWLVRSCGTYDDDVWAHLWNRHGAPAFRHYHNTRHTVPALLRLLRRHDGQPDGLFNPAFFERYRSEAAGVTVERLRPVARFEGDSVQLRYNVGTRGNGVDAPVWPDDLTVETVVC